jgi:phenylpropionate dioxygenase-like ring-hydroxylating dioxygenase large terminal subunit
MTEPVGLPIPSSWYCVGFSPEVGPATVLSTTLAGNALVLFRDASGRPVALDAWCPHLGAHLGVGGSVVDGQLRCPFHGFRFDGAGRCTATGYGGKVPPTASLRAWPCRETNGLLFVWYGLGGEDPWFEVPPIERAGWSGWRPHAFQLRGHPQEVAENSVDTGHLAIVHGYAGLEPTTPLVTERAVLRAGYRFERSRQLLLQSTLSVRIEIHQHGLGYALVEVETSVGLRTRQLVLAQPLGDDRLTLRIAMAVYAVEDPWRIHPALWVFPRGWVTERIADLAIREYAGDVAQDVPIWEHKRHLPRPALAEGDGPIGRYRRWVRSFYPDAGSDGSTG